VVFFDNVFGFLAALLVFCKELVKFFRYVFFAFATKHFATAASTFPFLQLRIVLLKEVNVVLEYAAD
jgi:hypothetical protein